MKEAQGLAFAQAISPADIQRFWSCRDAYMMEDIVPCCDPPMEEEERAWLFSDAYREHIMGLYERAVDPLRVVFLQKEGQYAGFIVYVTYHSEDGKCFILEYCIDRTRRGKGLGAAFFQAFEERMRLEGATYIALNTSNAHNRRFWLAQGFAVGDADEYGNPVYTKRL